MNTTQKGNLAQAKVVSALTDLGFSVYLPFGEGDKVDLIYIRDGVPIRSQIKHARLYKGVITFNTCTMAVVNGKSVRVYYDDCIDVFHIYCAETDSVYEVSYAEHTRGTMTMRITDPKNGQKSYVKFAKDYMLKKE